MRWSPFLFRWHRWFGYVVALQILAWVLGGLLFSWVPFQGWVKSGDVLKKPAQALPQHLDVALKFLPTDQGELLALQSVATATGPALKLRFAKGERIISAETGQPIPTPSSGQVLAYARSLYAGKGEVVEPVLLAEAPRRLGIVREMAARKDLWQVRFSDSLGSRFYFDGRSGEFLAARNEAWVFYDFLWRLHVMDYSEGEDFNNWLLRFASVAAILLTLTGLVLSAVSIRRRLRSGRKH